MRWFLMCACLLVPSITYGETFKQVIGNVQVKDMANTPATQVPYITWGGEFATFLANGGLETKQGSIYANLGLKLKLVNGDDPVAQVRNYMEGKSPYLRMTSRMAGLPLELLNEDPRTMPVMFLQLTWSAGDHIVYKEPQANLEVNGLKVAVKNKTELGGLKGKRIAIQRGGPHLDLLDDSLRAAGLKWSDITIVWCKDLTASADSPAEVLRAGKADAACVITPDMIGLTSGMKNTGNGTEGTVTGARVINSTAVMSKSIADVYLVRSDYYRTNRKEVEAFVVGYLKGTEELIKLRDQYNNGAGQSPEYIKVLKMGQQIFGEAVLPTVEEDAHGLLLDATFVRIPGNEAFFNDPNNLVGFSVKQKSAIDLALALGYATNTNLYKSGFAKANWDYKDISAKVGTKYVAPIYNQGRIKAEAIDFEKIGDDAILRFEVKFEASQTEFDPEVYAAEFQRIAESAHLFGNAAIVIKGHSDNYLVLKQFFQAAQSKGLLTRDNATAPWKYKGLPLDLGDTTKILKALTSENFAGAKDAAGQPLTDPRLTAQAAKQLSLQRAAIVKDAVQKYAESKGLKINLNQIQPVGAGIEEPAVPRPHSAADMAKNRRVEFVVVPINAEAISSGEDFSFDK